MSTPATPQHTGANEEMNIDDVRELDDRDVQDLDLDAGMESSVELPKRKATDDDADMFDLRDDFMPKVNISSPFSSQVDVQQLQAKGHSQRRLSMSQQSKFITYCDERLMAIQRKFVQSRGLTEENGYKGLVPLLQDMKQLLDFIWFSIDGIPNTEVLIEQDVSSVTINQYDGTKSTNIGQTYYLMRLADDFLDYLMKFDLKELDEDEQHNTLSKVFKFLIILDKIFARLLDGTVPGQTKMGGTEMVRLSGIAERTRVALSLYFSQQKLHGYHYEISKIYEETLERCA